MMILIQHKGRQYQNYKINVKAPYVDLKQALREFKYDQDSNCHVFLHESLFFKCSGTRGVG